MPVHAFCRYELRTTDMDAARLFYADVLGAGFWDAEVCLSSLPERAAARGAPAHWLGHIAVADVAGVAGVAEQVVALGGEPLGPRQRRAEGSSYAVLRNPCGAVIAVSSQALAPRGGRVAWHVSHSRDQARAFALYAGLFGWRATEELDLGAEHGQHQLFAWDESGRSVGSMSNGARLPHVHPQWLFFFRVDDIEGALIRVRARGGLTLRPTRIATGDIVVGCDDAQGAAFGLYQFAPG